MDVSSERWISTSLCELTFTTVNTVWVVPIFLEIKYKEETTCSLQLCKIVALVGCNVAMAQLKLVELNIWLLM